MPYEITYQEIAPRIGNPVTITSNTASVDIEPVTDGSTYRISVVAINSLGMRGPSTTLPDYVVIGKTLPPAAVTGFTVTVNKFGNYCYWNANTEVDLFGYEVRRGDSWDLGEVVYSGSTGTSFTDTKLLAGSSSYFIKAIDTTGNYSTDNIYKITRFSPSTLVVLQSIVEKDYILSWAEPNSTYAIDYYEIRTGASWASGSLVGTTKATVFQNPVDWLGDRTFHVAAIDIAGNMSIPTTIGISISPPRQLSLSAGDISTQVVDNNVLIYWIDARTSLPIDRCEFRRGDAWATAEVIGTKSGLFTTFFETTGGLYTYWLAAIDSAGNIGLAAHFTVYVNQPPDYILSTEHFSSFTGGIRNTLSSTDKHADIIISGTQVSKQGDVAWVSSRSTNSTSSATTFKKAYWEVSILAGGTYIMIGVGTSAVTLSGTHTAAGSYLYYGNNGNKYVNGAAATAYGASFTTGDIIGVALNMVTPNAGTLTLYKNGVSQGVLINTLNVAQHPIVSVYNGTELVDVNYGYKPFKYQIPDGYVSSNTIFYLNKKEISLPHNVTETWETHFTSRLWAGPQAQVTTGYAYFGQPTTSSAYYEEYLDYGTVIDSNKISVLYHKTLVSAPGIIITISVKTLLTDGWTHYVGSSEVFATNFQYIKVRYDVTSDGYSFADIEDFSIKLDAKLKNDAGTVTVDPGGTVVNFATLFVDVTSIVCQVLTGSTARFSIVDFVDVPNPTSFTIILYNTAGTSVGGIASWAAKGY